MSNMPQFRMGPISGIPVPNPGEMPQGMQVFMDMAPGMGFRIPFGMQGMYICMFTCVLCVCGEFSRGNFRILERKIEPLVSTL